VLEAGLVESQERARRLILAGQVRVDGRRVDKAGTLIAPEATVAVVGPEHPFVSRGGVASFKAPSTPLASLSWIRSVSTSGREQAGLPIVSFRLARRGLSPWTWATATLRIASPCFRGSRTTPPLPTSLFPTSNCGLIRATISPCEARRSLITGNTSVREMKATSITTRSGRAGR